MAEQKITKDMIIADILKVDEGLIPVLLNAGMHCVGCPSSLGETLEEAAEVHGIDADELCELLNEFVEFIKKNRNVYPLQFFFIYYDIFARTLPSETVAILYQWG